MTALLLRPFSRAACQRLLSPLAAACCWLAAPAAEVESQLRGSDLKGGGDAAVTLARTGSALDAPTGLGNLLASNADVALKATTALQMAGRRGMLHKTAQLIAASNSADAVIAQLAGDRRGQLLAAVSLAARATMVSLYQRANASGAGGGKGKRGGRVATGARDAELVGQFLAARSNEVQLYGLLAAAYLNAPELAEAVANCDQDSGPALGAKLRYLALNGIALDPEQVAAAFSARRQPRGPHHPVAELSDYNLLVPSQVLACEAIGLSGAATHLPLVHEALSSKDTRVRQAALQAIAAVGDPSSLPFLQELVTECNWAELVYACDALGRIPHRDSFAPLVERLADETGRMRLDIMYALNSIFGDYSYRQTAEAWAAWLETDEAKQFQVDPARSAAYREANGLFDNQVTTLGDFYGVGIYSDRLVFVLDTSASMKGDKIEDLRNNVVMTLEAFPRHVRYNMVDFGGFITVLYPGSLINDTRPGISWAQEMPMSWGTRSFDAIERGAQFDEQDTIFFLSDGAPIASQNNSWSAMHAMTAYMNRFRPLAVFTVCFKAGGGNAESMAVLARMNYGQTTNIE